METVKAHSTEVNELIKVMNTSMEKGLSEAEVKTLWSAEAEQRLNEMEEGKVTEIPVEDVLQHARDIIS